MPRQFNSPSDVRTGRTDYFHIFDGMSECADYHRERSRVGAVFPANWEDVCNLATNGSPKDAQASEAFMRRLEGVIENPGTRHEIVADVVGSFPNIPAYIAGQPLSMRRKVKRMHEAAPIALVVDGTTSGGMSNDDMAKRGAAILALARALSSRRPVELWSVAGLGRGASGGAAWSFVRIETAPMDLNRAAFFLANPQATRVLGFSACNAVGANGHWPYNGRPLTPDEFTKVIRRALPHVTDVVAIPGIIIHDPLIKNPVAWIKQKIAELGDMEKEAA